MSALLMFVGISMIASLSAPNVPSTLNSTLPSLVE